MVSQIRDLTLAQRLKLKDRIFVELKSNVLKRGIFLGLKESPIDASRKGLIFSPTPEFNVIEWVDLNYINEIKVI